MRIVIVGAGVAGCVMARRLSRLDGVEVICLERVARDDHSEAGTGLNVGPNAVKAVKAIDPELADLVTASSYLWHNWRISLTDGTVLFDLPLKNVADSPGWRIRWSELYRVLREAAGGHVSYSCEIAEIGRHAADPSKTSITWIRDGKTRRLDGIDLLIAADGRYSAVRRAISGEPEVQQTGVAIFRLLVPDTAGGLIDDYEQWFNGPNRLLSFKVPPGHIYVAGTFPISPEAPIAESLKTPDALRAAYAPRNDQPSAQGHRLRERRRHALGADAGAHAAVSRQRLQRALSRRCRPWHGADPGAGRHAGARRCRERGRADYAALSGRQA
jgi:salicylate hydroxylase